MTSAFETNTSDNIMKTIHNINEVIEKKMALEVMVSQINVLLLY